MELTSTAFRPLQPAEAGQFASRQYYGGSTRAPRTKRMPALGACVSCRERKSKCDGDRPVCKCCVQRETHCLYELGVNESLSDARRRKNEQIQNELEGLRHLYTSLRSCPMHEALEILHRVRLSPSDTLNQDCLTGLPRPLVQASPYHTQPADPLLTTQEPDTWQPAACHPSQAAKQLGRDTSPFNKPPTHCTLAPNAIVPVR